MRIVLFSIASHSAVKPCNWTCIMQLSDAELIAGVTCKHTIESCIVL